MPNREFVQLAKVYDNEIVSGWFMSEKLDGQRALWDGGISRGLKAKEVPYANTAKDGRLLIEPIATGLWSRYGKVIRAPDWFLDKLPKNVMVDGELYAGLNSFQKLRTIVADHVADNEDWKGVEYRAFDLPSWNRFSLKAMINNPNCPNKWINNDSFVRGKDLIVQEPYMFAHCYQYMLTMPVNEYFTIHKQHMLPYGNEYKQVMYAALSAVELKGGEGLMLRSGNASWHPTRNFSILKLKTFKDDEGTVVGYVTGRATEKGSKLLGMMGAMIVEWKGRRFQLSGFSDEERGLGVLAGLLDCNPSDSAFAWAAANPEKECPTWIGNPKFPRGSKITFRYRELTDDGLPKEARYWRQA